jgi:hypothetical protein
MIDRSHYLFDLMCVCVCVRACVRVCVCVRLRADMGQAVSWLRRAAAQGNPPAQHNLGVLYEEVSRVVGRQVGR